MFKTYYNLTKPGIIYGNAINTAAGFFLASHYSLVSKVTFDTKLLLMVLIGISLVVASACVFNNILDAGIDAKMERTKNRAMVVGKIKTSGAIIFGIILLILGILDLALLARRSFSEGGSTNHLALYTALIGFLVYVFLYTFLKRHTTWGTEIGSISGAIPPLVGYLSISNKLDSGAVILFIIFVLWQMPHFYAIAIYRLNEYKQAGIPVLPAIKGIYRTKINMLVYIIAFVIALAHLTIYHYTGNIYLVIMMLLGLTWLWMAIKGFKVLDDVKWAKKMFKFSLIIVLAFCLIIPIDRLIK
ncbi:MAG TPA: heme o synthase [Candidatus Limnocylindria bacterium]|nr:heme o synthase [Candidatus Limnocylindria bacterium]